MTTFTTEDRILAEKDGSLTVNVNAGEVTVNKDLTNEPVAWTDGKGNYFDKNSFFPADDLIPLYTHPAKTLTDEEIKEVWMNRPANTAEGVIDFARAILRKAQEK
jgi:hypothetical protein